MNASCTSWRSRVVEAGVVADGRRCRRAPQVRVMRSTFARVEAYTIAEPVASAGGASAPAPILLGIVLRVGTTW
jgi:hypothetical protein